jgi:hypothetical protein
MAKADEKKSFRQWLLHRDGKRMPLTEAPLRNAGDGVGDMLDDALMATVFRLVLWFALPTSALITTVHDLLRADWSQARVSFVLTLILCAVLAPFFLYWFRRQARKLSDLRLGYLGEKIVGQRLEETRYRGARVFHDLECEKDGRTWNVDHLVIARSGIYVVETKARAKSAPGKPKAWSDGQLVCFSDGGYAPEAIPQVRRNADDVDDWLQELLQADDDLKRAFAKGRRLLPVRPVVVYPGWYATDDRPEEGRPFVANDTRLVLQIGDPPDDLLDQDEVEALSELVEKALRAQRKPILDW